MKANQQVKSPVMFGAPKVAVKPGTPPNAKGKPMAPMPKPSGCLNCRGR